MIGRRSLADRQFHKRICSSRRKRGGGTYLQESDWFSGGCFEAGETVLSKKHLRSYLDEYAFQYNHRADPNGMFKGLRGCARQDSNLRPSDS